MVPLEPFSKEESKIKIGQIGLGLINFSLKCILGKYENETI